MQQVLTASHLISGEVIYLSSDKKWVDHLAKAVVFDNQEEAENARTYADSLADELVDAHLIDVVLASDSAPKPKSYREQIRASGPTNYFHGKQEDTG
ncbi:MAG: sulfite reductase [Deltaproteobacteria bacterium]|jgi:hypothetical protein|nr:sulfite reductase [Deltaproteobacteria bacterium]|tara:strand:+ start:1897 stop:2187 length:291 start_codon:yes stop_codon:yes gene_type:complete